MLVLAVKSCNVIVSLTWADVGVVCCDSSVIGHSVRTNVYAFLYSFNTVLIFIPQDSITRGWAAQRIGG